MITPVRVRRYYVATPWQKLQQRAHAKVSGAVYRGELPKRDGSIACVDCGKVAEAYDHRDYRKPVDVEPVCSSCNARRGSAVRFLIQMPLEPQPDVNVCKRCGAIWAAGQNRWCPDCHVERWNRDITYCKGMSGGWWGCGNRASVGDYCRTHAKLVKP